MPLRRRFRRKRTIPKRRIIRHRRRVVPRRRFNKSNICHFKRTYIKETITISGGTPLVSKAYSFALSDVTNATEFTSLFQAYRLNKIVFKLQPRFNVVNPTATLVAPQIITAIDYNDDSGSFNASSLLEFGTHRVHFGFKPIIRKFTPACEVALLGASTAVVSGIQKFKQWIDTAAPDAKHFGVKLNFTTLAAFTAPLVYDVYVTTYFSCKQLQ